MEHSKELVKNFWEEASCGEKLYLQGLAKEDFLRQAEIRYRLEPFIPDFAEFEKYRGKKVLEIGVGLGADHQRFAEAGADLCGIDLTQRAIDNVRHRFQIMGLNSNLAVGDAENLDFDDGTFDLVYSWGVIHCSPDTVKCAKEIMRVLKPGGEFKVMIYHKHSFVGYMLWFRYALMKLRPFMTLDRIYDQYLESPGTKAYSVEEALKLFPGAASINIWTVLTHGDLLTSEAGQRHKGLVLSAARAIWPRFLIRHFFKNHGLFMMISGKKGTS
jgi:ubiquinone/menaquinone biosynthesis C-methylase UbiE